MDPFAESIFASSSCRSDRRYVARGASAECVVKNPAAAETGRGRHAKIRKGLKFHIDKRGRRCYNNTRSRECRLGVAQLGSVLEWGSRGRRFKSSHPDQLESLVTRSHKALAIITSHFPAITIRSVILIKKKISIPYHSDKQIFSHSYAPQTLAAWKSRPYNLLLFEVTDFR